MKLLSNFVPSLKKAYNHCNNLFVKFKPKRRFGLELDELIIAMIVRFCGGDPSLVFR